MIEMSATIGELAKALATAQGSMHAAKKSKTNPFHKNKYADLTDVWEAAKLPLSTNGLSVVQLPASENGYLMLTTMLMHSSGEWVRNTFKIKSKADTAQDMGGALTYARRYALASIIGNSSDEDDDGNSAQGLSTKSSPRMFKHLPEESDETYQEKPEQKLILRPMFEKFGITDKAAMAEISHNLLGKPMSSIEESLLGYT